MLKKIFAVLFVVANMLSIDHKVIKGILGTPAEQERYRAEHFRLKQLGSRITWHGDLFNLCPEDQAKLVARPWLYIHPLVQNTCLKMAKHAQWRNDWLWDQSRFNPVRLSLIEAIVSWATLEYANPQTPLRPFYAGPFCALADNIRKLERCGKIEPAVAGRLVRKLEEIKETIL